MECFEFSLGGTVRRTIRTKCLIEPGDNVLVALSGGSSSLALLLLLQDICASKQTAAKHGQVKLPLALCKSQGVPPDDGLAILTLFSIITPYDTKSTKALSSQQVHTMTDCVMVLQETFRLGAIHIDETLAYDSTETTDQHRIQEVQSTLSCIDESMPFHSALLEDALPSEEGDWEESSTMDRRQQIQEVLTVRLCANRSLNDALKQPAAHTGGPEHAVLRR